MTDMLSATAPYAPSPAPARSATGRAWGEMPDAQASMGPTVRQGLGDAVAMNIFQVISIETPVQARYALIFLQPDALKLVPGFEHRWTDIAKEPNAPAFASVLSNIEMTEAYRNPVTRPRVQAQMNALLEEIFWSPAFRAMCFTTALNGADSCHDRVAVAFADMSFALISHKAEKGDYPDPMLLKMGRGMYRSQKLDEIALKKIAEKYARGDAIDDVDEVDIRLAYQSKLAEKLELPAVPPDMRYFASASVSESDLQDAERQIKDLERDGSDMKFLADWKPWQTAMKKRYPEVFAKLVAKIEQDRDWLVMQPDDMNTGQYMAACEKQKAIEAVKFAQVMIEQTKTSLREIPEPVTRIVTDHS